MGKVLILWLVALVVLFSLPALAQRSDSGNATDSPEARLTQLAAADCRREKLGRQRLDAGVLRAGTDDDRPGSGAVLRRAGAQEERSRHHDAELRHDGGRYGGVGAGAAIASASASGNSFHRRLESCLPARSRRRSLMPIMPRPFPLRPS